MKTLNIGWACADITPDRPIYVCGQIYGRVSTYVHDPLFATALVLENGEEQCILVSVDMVAPPDEEIVGLVCAELAAQHPEIDPEKISFGATHTHNSTRFTQDGISELRTKYFPEDVQVSLPVPEDILGKAEGAAFLTGRLVYVITAAWEKRKPGGVAWASDYAAVGFNRRPVFRRADGSEFSMMYGDCSRSDFDRFEGTSDHSADMLYTFDESVRLTGVAVDIPCPSQVMELHSFLSADYWGYVRAHIRRQLGDGVFVLPLCGAAGDQNPLDLVRISKTNRKELTAWNAQAGEVHRHLDLGRECDAIGRRIADAVARGFDKTRSAIHTAPELRHRVVSLSLPIRRVSEDEALEARRFIAEAQKQFTPEHPMTPEDQVRVFEPIGVLERYELQNRTDIYSFRMNVIRLGRVAIVTNPFELFTDYALRVRARCQAEQVFHVQLSNGCGDYLPTRAAILGGSYSSKPASTFVGPEGGDMLVERMLAELDALWS